MTATAPHTAQPTLIHNDADASSQQQQQQQQHNQQQRHQQQQHQHCNSQLSKSHKL